MDLKIHDLCNTYMLFFNIRISCLFNCFWEFIMICIVDEIVPFIYLTIATCPSQEFSNYSILVTYKILDLLSKIKISIVSFFKTILKSSSQNTKVMLSWHA